ncbi:MAG: threonyl-tRNA synthetase [Candidatus Poribacteria bacterium]|nr:threonyl-tRNA synthetase [Candidatus Poribacteria bacterium]
MAEIVVELPDGSQRKFPVGIALLDVASSINDKLAQRAVTARVNGELVDLTEKLVNDCKVEIITFDSDEGKEIYWHSTSHVMASAVKMLFPNAGLAIGPAIKEGFYYDFDVNEPFVPEDLERIEEKMRKIIEANLPFFRNEITKSEAVQLFTELNEKYKLELLEGITDDTVTVYRHGNFVDLCRGPHLAVTGKIKAFKLLSIAGAYWHGDEKNKMLQRIYGIAFETQKELDDYLHRIEEAQKRDHRKLGKELDLFSLHEQEAGPGLVFWHPKGAAIRRIIEDFWKDEHLKRGYEIVITPHIAKSDLWNTSGHYSFFRENMFVLEVEDQEYVLKPMNCPGHILIYQTKMRSYRDLPIRYAELGTVYRYERSGTLAGLFRVRGFTQDDAHIFCTHEQAPDEILDTLDLALFMLKTFGYDDYKIELAVRDPQNKEKYLGTDEMWERAESALVTALNARNLPYNRMEGEAVFYGPKIDIKLLDAIGRAHQGPTIQFDFNEPKNFDVNYVGQDGQEHQVIMIHRVVLGSMERFFGGLIEHYTGAFPVWLAPVQARILPVTSDLDDYARMIKDEMLKHKIRVEADLRSEKLGFKIREAQLEKVPYMLVVGKREAEANTVSVRLRGGEDLGVMPIESIIDRINTEVNQKK